MEYTHLLLFLAGTIFGLIMGLRLFRHDSKSDQSSDQLIDHMEMSTRLCLQDIIGQFQREQIERQTQLQHLMEDNHFLTKQLAETSHSLSSLLSNNQERGAMGEVIIEGVLQKLGLVEGVHFDKQVTNTQGSRPDFVFYLPGDRVLIMDSKFPFNKFWQLLSDQANEKLLKEFLQDVRRHIKSLSKKGYPAQEQSLNFCCLIIPSDEMYLFMIQKDPMLLEMAHAHDVMLAGPGLIYPLLLLTKNCIDLFQITHEKSAGLKLLQDFEREWGAYTQQLEELELHLRKAYSALDKLQGPKKRSLNKILARKNDLNSPSPWA